MPRRLAQKIRLYSGSENIGSRTQKIGVARQDGQQLRDAVARVESELARLAEAAGLSLHLRRTEARTLREDHIPYSIDVIGPDQAGIVAGLAGFLTARQVEIAEVASRSYAAAQTGALMFAVQMAINVPTRLPIAQLREDFLEYCDSQNLDAILEPVKN